jgi:hypothetical protein
MWGQRQRADYQAITGNNCSECDNITVSVGDLFAIAAGFHW